jgi:hypothetical protein
MKHSLFISYLDCGLIGNWLHGLSLPRKFLQFLRASTSLTYRGKELVRIPRNQRHSNEAEGAKQFHIYLRIGEWVRQYICDITSSLACWSKSKPSKPLAFVISCRSVCESGWDDVQLTQEGVHFLEIQASRKDDHHILSSPGSMFRGSDGETYATCIHLRTQDCPWRRNKGFTDWRSS